MAMKNLLYYFQKPTQTNSDYHQDFLAMIKSIKDYGGAGSLTYFPNMIKKELVAVKAANKNTGTATQEEQKDARKIMCDKFLVALMLNGSNQAKYGELKRSMAENYVTETSEYPTSPEMVYASLMHTPLRQVGTDDPSKGEERMRELYSHSLTRKMIGKRTSLATNAGRRGILPGSVKRRKATRKKTRCMPM